MSVQLYEGVLAALDSLKSLGLNINLYIHDTKRSTSTIRSILSEQSTEDSHIVIGPVFNDNAKLVAEFCRQSKILNISPKTPSRSIAIQNPYHIKINPTLAAHCKQLVRYLMEKTNNKSLNIIIRESDRERGIAYLFFEAERTLSRELNKQLEIEVIEVEETKYGHFKFDADEHFDFSNSDSTAIAIGSFDESFVQNMLAKIHAYALISLKGNFENTPLFFGMPTWSSSQSLRLDYLCDLAVHVTNTYHISDSSIQYDSLCAQIQERFYYTPAENTVLGYDIMRFAGAILMSDVRIFPGTNQAYKGLSTQFILEEVFDDGTESGAELTNYLQNSYLHILKYEDYNLKKVY